MSNSTVITNIAELTTNCAEVGERLNNAAVVVEGQTIVWVGPASEAPMADEQFDAAGRAVLPGWVDSHTHMIFAGDRTAEFEARMSGEPYAAGGINVTVQATRAASDAELTANLSRLVRESRQGGTTTIETKTGYGLTVEDELRSAKIAQEQADSVTFLGAHVVPKGLDAQEYLDLVNGPMLEAVAPFVNAVDVFCEEGAFDEEQSRQVLVAATQKGLATRVHGNQLGHGPGVQIAVEHGSLSVDHLGFLTEQDVELLGGSWSSGRRGTVATVLPACDLSTRMPLADARKLLDAGATVAIASNCNPGTSYTTSMSFCVATAVLQMGLSVQEAVRAATLGGAIALDLDRRVGDRAPVGRVTLGAQANLQLLDAPSITHLAYRPGVPLTAAVWRRGEQIV